MSSATAHEIAEELEGKTYTGQYTVRAGIVIVSWMDKHGGVWDRRVSIHSDTDREARVVFRAMLTDAKQRGDLP